MKFITLIVFLAILTYILPLSIKKAKKFKKKSKRCSDYMPKVVYTPGTSPMDRNPPSIADDYLAKLQDEGHKLNNYYYY